jgi:outer membrane receptor protein involved in Fe transport
MPPRPATWFVLAIASHATGHIPASLFQQARVVGRVIDATRHPIDGVEVIVNQHQVRSVTANRGLFTVDISRADSTIAFRRIGYRPVVFSIRPLPVSGDTILVELESSPVQLEAVTVSAEPTKPLRYASTRKYDDVFHRQKIGLGRLVPREVIDARLGSTTDQLLDGIAGVHVWNGPPKRIRFVRCQDPGGIAIFIDGVRQISSQSSSGGDNSGLLYKPPTARGMPADMEPEVEVLQRVNPGDIEMIEVFPGPSEIPAEFHWNGCAVIAIWTRQGNS